MWHFFSVASFSLWHLFYCGIFFIVASFHCGIFFIVAYFSIVASFFHLAIFFHFVIFLPPPYYVMTYWKYLNIQCNICNWNPQSQPTRNCKVILEISLNDVMLFMVLLDILTNMVLHQDWNHIFMKHTSLPISFKKFHSSVLQVKVSSSVQIQLVMEQSLTETSKSGSWKMQIYNIF